MRAEVLDTATLTRERQFAAWMPDLALVLCVLTFGYVLFLFDGWHKLFRDSDTGWHIVTGEAILLNRALPHTDPYSFSRAGAPWLDWEWASDVVAGATHSIAGLPGVAMLFAGAIAVCTWLWVQLTWKLGGGFLLACVLAAPMLSTVNMHWLARPHVFGWVLLLGWMIWMERGRGWWGAVLIGALWANLHASFFLAPVVALLYAVGSALRPFIWNLEPDRQGTAWYVRSAVLVLLGSLINPYGFRLHAHVAGYLADSELLSHVGEFQSFNFFAGGSGWILATVGIAAIGAVLSLTNGRLDHFFVSMFLIAVALRSARGLPIVALCVLPIANASITEALRRAASSQTQPIEKSGNHDVAHAPPKPPSGRQPRGARTLACRVATLGDTVFISGMRTLLRALSRLFSTPAISETPPSPGVATLHARVRAPHPQLAPWLGYRLKLALEYSDRLRELDRGLSGWALIPVVLLGSFFLPGTVQAGFSPDQFPVAAADSVSALPPNARLLAPDKFGGYLIYRFQGKRKVYFDGRSDFYGAPFMKEYLRLLEVRPGWDQTIAQLQFTHALLPNDYSLVAALGSAGWKVLHKDATATLLAAPGQ